MSTLGWSALSATGPEGKKKTGKDRDEAGGRQTGKGSEPRRVTALQRQHSTWPKSPCRVKITNTPKERDSSYSNRLCPLTLSAGSSGLIYITCKSLFEASTAPLWMGSLALLSWPLGLACLTHIHTYIHAALVMQIHQSPWLSLSRSQALVLRISIHLEHNSFYF